MATSQRRLVDSAQPEPPGLDTVEVTARLRRRHQGRGWAFLTEVRDSTGYSGFGRSADAVAIDIWPSRGNEVHGFEIKVSRGDWLRELKDPSKAEPVARFVDRWWIVAGASGIVDKDELPKTWGLMVPDKKDGLRVAKQAPPLDAVPMTRAFIASIIRNALETASEEPADITKLRMQLQKEALDLARIEVKSEIESVRGNAERLYAKIAQFERESGVSLDNWNLGRIGAAVRILANHDAEHALLSQRALLKRLSANLDEAIAQLPKREIAESDLSQVL